MVPHDQTMLLHQVLLNIRTLLLTLLQHIRKFHNHTHHVDHQRNIQQWDNMHIHHNRMQHSHHMDIQCIPTTGMLVNLRCIHMQHHLHHNSQMRHNPKVIIYANFESSNDQGSMDQNRLVKDRTKLRNLG